MVYTPTFTPGQNVPGIIPGPEVDQQDISTGVQGALGTYILTISAATLTLTDNDHNGKMLSFTGVCTVTVPPGLRADFSCGWSQTGASAVTFVAGAGVTINSASGTLISTGQYGIGGLSAFALNVYRVYGAI